MLVRVARSVSEVGSGITSLIPTENCGLLPQVTVGSIAAASMLISLSKTAVSSECSVLQCGGVGSTVNVGQGLVIRCDDAESGACFNGHIADGHAAFDR